MGLTATELSARQAQALADDVAALLTGAGVPAAAADAVRAELAAVQDIAGTRGPRWYEVF